MPTRLPDALVQELRNLLALNAREVLAQSKADGAKASKQVEFLEKVYHGSATWVSVCAQSNA